MVDFGQTRLVSILNLIFIDPSGRLFDKREREERATPRERVAWIVGAFG
jgi:hypothetical protein